ncbi:M50 family metallopeptidase [Paraliomyxa miuraensis]|uniref:M50 family metallopeptidase n=1 Tax=Paraliomyxa miuraensis TaxID=376150 RepID=UPI00225A71ED|nr:M50 family metallopeptidase [Paraliomyxa miuraensis]MCX4240895.1 M50 family metallopeptidase [Paraliomyxa miuraensis]
MSTRGLEDWMKSEAARRRTKAALVWSIVLTALLYSIPFGQLIGYPLILLSTLVHEAGHGLAAIVVGGNFERFVMFADASGMAYSTGVQPGWPQALVAAGGLVGPALVAGLAFVAARRAGWSRAFLVLMSAVALALLVLVVRNPFGIAFVGIVATLLGWLGLRGSSSTTQIATVFMAVQLSLSVFSRGDYLFMKEAHTGAGTAPSDVSLMANALGGPYWGWGLACGVFSVVVLVGGVWAFWRALSKESPLARTR